LVEVNEVGALCVAGQEAESIQKILQQSFREFPVQVVEYNDRTLVDISGNLLDRKEEFRLAIALAYSGLRTSAVPVNLRREEFAAPPLISRMKSSIIRSATIILIMLLAWFGNVRAQIYSQSKQLEDLKKEMEEIFPGVSSPSAAEEKIREEQKKLMALGNYSSEYISPLEILAEVAKSAPQGKNLALSEMHISENIARLRGSVDSFDDIEVFKRQLEDSLFLSNVNIESAAKAEKGKKVNFRIRAQIKREPAPDASSRSEDGS
jgi:hypothetical protein